MGIAIAIATFIPTLIYGYARNLIDDIKDGKGRKPIKEEEARKIAGFIFAIDLLVTQTMALVIVTSLSGLWTYISFLLGVQLYKHLCSVYSIGIIVLFISYLILLCKSNYQFRENLKKEYDFERWCLSGPSIEQYF